MNLFYQPLILQGVLHLDAEESRHCVKVLRRKNGDAIRITDGAGFFYDAVISDASPARCQFTITGKEPELSRDYFIHIAIAPTKNSDRIEWFVEKATEIGIDRITLLDTAHTERAFLKKERLQKVALSAMKQSLKAKAPEITELRDIASVVKESDEAERFIAYVDDKNPRHLNHAASRGKTYLVLIGPEGDFSAEELSTAVSHGFMKVSLGRSRLRTETAGVAACHILNLLNT